MTIDEIRKFKTHEPFEPFEIVLVPPGRGTWVYVPEETGNVEHLNTVVIRSLRHSSNG